MVVLERNKLGENGPTVSRLCLGTMMFGDRTDEAEARDILAMYAEAGGNFIDTADVYAGGESEKMVGRMIRDQRESFVVATKLGNQMPDTENASLSANYIPSAIDASRGRLGLDVIDILYLHRDDEATPLAETIVALGEEIERGHIRHWGFSNFRGWKIAEMVRMCDELGVARPVCAQPYYHALYREAERDILPACHHYQIGAVTYSPLARGLLTGKYRDSAPEGSRGARRDKRISETELRPAAIEAARLFDDHAQGRGRTSAGLAVQWVLANKAVTSVLAGPRTVAQLQGYLDAIQTPFDSEDEAFVEELVPAGCAAGSTYFDPRYPYRGRFTGDVA
jgi:aryl-alcohol dehydrogenase-like predicted oxidoreductase